MRSRDGSQSLPDFVAGCDPRGERLILWRPDGTAIASERVQADLHAQLLVALRREGIDASGDALAAFAGDLQMEVVSASDSAQEDFYGRLLDGDLYRLLRDGATGIGNRHPWDVASVMREGPQPRPMLLAEWLVSGELHWIAAEPEAGKTWFGLWLAWRVIEAGGVVVWTDEELGVDTVAERLLALGADPDLIEKRLVYLAYPGWQAEPEDIGAWVRLVQAARPSLVVIDTATDALAEAGVDENSGAEVTAWVKAYCEPPRRVGAAVLVLDHVVKGGTGQSRGYAVGSRAKKAKAKIQYQFDALDGYGPDKLGCVTVKRTKNGVGGDIPEVRSFKVGGEGGRFIIEPTDPLDSPASKRAAARAEKQADLRDRCEALIRATAKDGEGPLNKSQIRDRVSGGNTDIGEALAELAESKLHPVEASEQGRSTVYEWTGG